MINNFLFFSLPDHVHHLHHRNGLLKEDLYHDKDVGHQLKPMNRQDHCQQKLFSMLMVS